MAGSPEQSPIFYTKVVVMPKTEFADPQGDALAGAARRLGIDVRSVRQGKVFHLTQHVPTGKEADLNAADLAAELLANPVVEHVPEIITVTEKGELFTGNVPKPNDPTA